MMPTVNMTIIFPVLLVALYLLVAGAILKRRGRQEQPIGLLLLYVALSFLWMSGQAAAQLEWPTLLPDGLLERLLFYAPPLLSLLFFHLLRSFLQPDRTGRWWWASSVVWMAAVVVLDENPLALPDTLQVGDGWTIQRQELVSSILFLGWGGLMGWATFLTAKVYQRTRRPLHRNRIRFWVLALILTIAGAALFFSGRQTLGSGCHLLGTLSAVYVTLTYHLPDMRQMARRIASYLTVTLLAVIMYTVGFLGTQRLFQSVSGYSSLLAGAAMALVVAILFHPLLGRVQRLVNRLTSGTSYDPGRILRAYSTNISNILDLEHLAAVSVGLISEALDIRRSALFMVHYKAGKNGEASGSGHFHLEGMEGVEEELPTGILSASSPVADYLCRERRPLLQYDIDLLPRFQDISPAENAWLAELDMDVYVPICAKGEWIGLLVLGSKVSGDCFFEGDLILLRMLADQTAVALENARLFNDLKNQNVANEQLNQELTAVNREMARLGRAKSDFIDIASHELRTPLTQVRGYNDILSEVIERKSLSLNVGEEMTKNIRKATQRLEEIVNTMLDVSKIETETLGLNLSPTSIASIVSMAVSVWAKALEERRQVLTVEGLQGLPLISADSKRLTQSFSCLIQNAIKYTPDGGHIRIAGRLLDEDVPPQEQVIQVVVADTGIGIARDNLERIFEKFYRVGDVLLHSTGETKFKGAGPGLGLTLARGIVEAHSGHIWAESPDQNEETCPGAAFYVLLPVQPRRAELVGSRATTASRARSF